jgi:BirA family transcriptional regulator, biotin operon repressor / biotin---[acetyl-CoA-carboxylase] ligase
VSPGPPVVRFRSVDSTQSLVFSLADGGMADGTAVVADYQRLGRGRRGRRWDAVPGTSLLVSILVRPRLAARDRPLLSFAAAVAVAGALERLVPVAPRLKWPNDVLVGGRKIAGILLECRAAAPDAAVVAVGIGVNLRQREFPSDLETRATSLFLAAGVDVERDQALTAVLDEFGPWRARLEREGFAPVRERWLELAETIGRRVTVDGVDGTAVDLAGDGALVVDDGATRHRVVAGEVSWPGVAGGGIGEALRHHDLPGRSGEDHAARR